MSQVDNSQSEGTTSGNSAVGREFDAEQPVNETESANAEAQRRDDITSPSTPDVESNDRSDENDTEPEAKEATSLRGSLVEKSDGSAYPNGRRVTGIGIDVDDDGQKHVAWFSEVEVIEDDDQVNIIA